MNGDLTERKRAEAEHGDGEQKLRAITDNLSEGLVIASTDGQLLHWNKASRAMFGFGSEEAGLRKLPEFVDTFELSTLDGRILKWEEWPLARIIAGERLHDLELRLKRFGVERPFVLSFSGALVKDEAGKFVAFLSFSDITERKRNEEALVTSLKEVNELRAALDEHAIVAITDPQGKITYVNDRFCTISKYAREELLGQDHRIINSGFHSKEFIRGLWTTIARGEVWHGEIKNKAKDGSFYWVDTTIMPFLNEQGKPRQYVAIRGDITELKLAEMASIRLSAIVEYSDDAIIGKDLNGIITSWNKGANKIFGYAADEIVGTSILRLIPGDRQDEENLILGSIRRGESMEHFETVRQTKSGRLIDVSITASPIKNALGIVIGVSKVARDITERKRSENALRVSLKEVTELRTALDEHAIVAITDPHGKITFVNDKFCTISKYAREELLGQDHRVINSDHHPKEFIRDLWTTIAHGRVWHGEIKNKAKDGSFYWVDTTIVPFLDEQGKPSQYVAIRADITERKRAEESLQEARTNLEQRVRVRTAELADAKERAESANASKSEFLANMSHELRTPLNGVIGISSFLATQKPGPLNAKQREYLADIQSSGRHLLHLVNDVLDLSKVEAGKMELFPERFSLTQAVDGVCAILSPAAERKRIAIATDISPAVEHVTLDQQMFKQVLFNLLSNAVKFTQDGGRVEIIASLDRDRLRLQVRDSGIGIKPEDIGKLFVEFQQLDSSPSRRYEGTGLGLALSRKIVEFQAGTVTVESQPGNGSTFTVVLPCRSKEQN